MSAASVIAVPAARARKTGQRGGSLLYVIGALMVLGALGTAIQSQFGTGLGVSLTENRADSAVYAAYSGLNYASAQTDSGLAALHAGGARDYALSNGVVFRLTVGAKDTGTGAYPVTVIGTANAGTGLEANASMSASVTPASSGGPPPAAACRTTSCPRARRSTSPARCKATSSPKLSPSGAAPPWRAPSPRHRPQRR